jgi:aldehyde dehydrogenase (NAD+)
MTYKNWIGGEWLDSQSGETFESINPADSSDSLGEFARSSSADIDAAVKAADSAYATWSRYPAPKRGELLYAVADILKEKKEELSQLMTREMGKTLNETRGDVQEAIDMAYYIGAEGRRMQGYVSPSELPNKTCQAVRRPIGRIALITPWNFPIAVPSWKIFPALIAGNTFVWKPAEDTPRLAYEFAKVFEEAGIQKGVFNLVYGYGEEAGQPLAEHPKIDMISFTGSVETGRHVYQVGAKKINPVHLELGGKNPIVVLEDADLDLAADGVLWSAMGTTGQRCTACSRLIVQESVHDEMVSKLVAAAGKLKLGNGLNDGVNVGPIINQKQLKQIHEYVELGVKEGAEIAIGGKIANDGDLANGHFYEPTIFTNVTRDMRIFQEEIFGPVLSVVKARDYEHAVELANDTTYGLSSAIFTRDVYTAQRAMEDLESGITYINYGTTGAEVHLPFGGIKNTGNGGREAGTAAIDAYSEWKTIYNDYSGHMQKAQGLE